MGGFQFWIKGWTQKKPESPTREGLQGIRAGQSEPLTLETWWQKGWPKSGIHPWHKIQTWRFMIFFCLKCLSDQKHEGFTNNHCIIIHEYHQEPGQRAWLASPGMQTCWPRMFRAMKNSWCNSATNISVQHAKPFVIMMLQSQSEVQISKLDCLEANKNWKPWFLPEGLPILDSMPYL